MGKQGTLSFFDPGFRDGKRKFCQRCWPERSKAKRFGVFGYEALCDGCYNELHPDKL